jgi:hypothetical protein
VGPSTMDKKQQGDASFAGCYNKEKDTKLAS